MIPKAHVWLGTDRVVWYWKCPACLETRDKQLKKGQIFDLAIVGGVGDSAADAGDLARSHLFRQHGWWEKEVLPL